MSMCARLSFPNLARLQGLWGTGWLHHLGLLSYLRRSVCVCVCVCSDMRAPLCCSQIFKACEALGGCIIFLDELDSLATSRDQGDMHEASRRLLGVLLREVDGFNHREPAGAASSDGSGGDSSRRSVVIGATNRRQDLDAALLSRCELCGRRWWIGWQQQVCRRACWRLVHLLSKTTVHSTHDAEQRCWNGRWASGMGFQEGGSGCAARRIVVGYLPMACGCACLCLA